MLEVISNPIFQKLSYFLLVVVLSFCVYIIFLAPKKENFKKKKKTDLKKTRKLNNIDGIMVGKKNAQYYFSPYKGESHVAIFGGTGSGKTAAVMIPTLRAWKGTSFVIDISGDISAHVDCDRLVFDPFSAKSSPYNIFAPIDKELDRYEKLEMLDELALQIIPDPETKVTDSAGSFFRDNARRMLKAALINGYFLEEDFCDICAEIYQNHFKTLYDQIIDGHVPEAINEIQSFNGANEKNTSESKKTLDDYIELFAKNEKLRKNFRRPRTGEEAITPELLEKKSIFIAVPDRKSKLYFPVLSIITAQTLAFLSSRPIYDQKHDPRPKILLSLDEFSSLGYLDILQPVQKYRKLGIRIMIATQDLADIDRIYGMEGRRSIMANFRLKIILGIEDPDSQVYFSRLAGKRTEKKESGYEQEKSVFPPESFGTLTDDLIYINFGLAEKIKKAYYFEN